MIQRFCFARLRDGEAAGRERLAHDLAAALRAAGADAVVGLPADDSAIKWDISIVITAGSLAAWQALAAVPAIAAVLDDLARRSTVVKAWSFAPVA